MIFKCRPFILEGMEPQIRRYFAFTRLYYEVWANLPSFEQKAKFVESVANYGLDRQEPDLGDDPTLRRAWKTVFPDLSYSWGQRDSGEHGGIVTSTKRTAKPKDTGTGKASEEQGAVLTRSNEFEGFPDGGKPKDVFLRFLKHFELVNLATAPKPLTGEQMRWFVDHFGEITAASLCKYYETYITKHGGTRFWKEYGLTDKSAGALLLDLYRQTAAAFDDWLASTFPKVAKMNKPLTFAQYHELRVTYGRANLIVKLSQLNDKKVIYKNAAAAATLDNWLNASISKGKSSRFWLPKYDDNVANANISECLPGYDETFDLPCCTPFNYKTFYDKEHGRT